MSVLDTIVGTVRERLAERRRRLPESELRARADAAPSAPSFRAALAAPGTSLIAEAKRRSPSRPGGFGAAGYDPAALARSYERGGARAMSVLTEPDFFGGSGAHLESARGACSLPLLRKDFVVDAYQCWEAKAWGASAALLIVAALEDALLADLQAALRGMGLDALVEVHTEREADRALARGDVILGVNNRDLSTFVTDPGTTARVAAAVPAGTLLVAESGIATRADVVAMERAGASAVLVGEAIVAAADPEAKVRELAGAEARA
jgi:indole-3-glycerol phosphate synthase